MLQGFKQFILKGNVVDLAVGVVIGVAFGSVVTALVKDIITPIIGAIGGKPDFEGISFTLNHSKFLIGDFLNAVISFLIIAAVIYFFVVIPMNKLISATRKEKPVDPTTRKCPECLSIIPIEAKHCAFLPPYLASKINNSTIPSYVIDAVQTFDKTLVKYSQTSSKVWTVGSQISQERYETIPILVLDMVE